MSNQSVLKVLENNQRRSSVHVDIEILPEENQNKDKAIEANIEDINKSPTSTGGKKRPRTGVNCPFMAFYGGRSPDRKRKKNKKCKEKSKMMTFKDPTDDPTYEAETIALSSITENIENKLVIELIDKFSPVIRNFPEQIKEEMLELSAEWPNKREIFTLAINSVSQNKEDDNKKSELKDTCIGKLCELLVREIDNRMPKHCRKCDKHYIVKLDDCPELHCMWCRVGMHDCIEMSELKNRPGIVWLCETCEPIFNTHYLPKLDPVAGFEGFNSNPVPSKRSLSLLPASEDQGDKGVGIIPIITIGNSTPPEIVPVESELNVVVVEAEIHQSEGDDTNQDMNVDNGNDNNENERRNDESNKSKKKCWFYENRKCKFGENCKDLHPEVCKPMAEYGKCRDSRCKLLHQKICRNYYTKGNCKRYNCWFIHPTKMIQRNPQRASTNEPQQESNTYRNNMNQYRRSNEAQYDNMNNNNTIFLWNWPTPPQTSMNIQQMLTKLVGTIENVDTRIERLEMRHTNRWAY